MSSSLVVVQTQERQQQVRLLSLVSTEDKSDDKDEESGKPPSPENPENPEEQSNYVTRALAEVTKVLLAFSNASVVDLLELEADEDEISKINKTFKEAIEASHSGISLASEQIAVGWLLLQRVNGRSTIARLKALLESEFPTLIERLCVLIEDLQTVEAIIKNRTGGKAKARYILHKCKFGIAFFILGTALMLTVIGAPVGVEMFVSGGVGLVTVVRGIVTLIKVLKGHSEKSEFQLSVSELREVAENARNCAIVARVQAQMSSSVVRSAVDVSQDETASLNATTAVYKKMIDQGEKLNSASVDLLKQSTRMPVLKKRKYCVIC